MMNDVKELKELNKRLVGWTFIEHWKKLLSF
jgi:hypothetical protein